MYPTDARGGLSLESAVEGAFIRHHFMVRYPLDYPLLQWAGNRLSYGYQVRLFPKRSHNGLSMGILRG
jgi:hypothetical protein